MIRTSARILGFASVLAILAACGDDATTSPAPAASAVGHHGITVLAPNGGETLRGGASATLKWSYNADSLTSARLLLTCNGVDWADLTKGGSMNLDARSGAQVETTLVVPDSVFSRSKPGNILLSGSACSFKVQDYTMTYNFDTSDVRFVVQPK